MNKSHFASYIIHLLPVLPSQLTDIERLVLWNEALDSLTSRSLQLPALMFSPQWSDLDAYLRLQPDRIDQIALLIQQGRIWFGGWYRLREGNLPFEVLVRDLMMAQQSAQVFETKSTGLFLSKMILSPEISQGFGFRYAYRIGGFPSRIFVGQDGMRLPLVEMVHVDEIFDPIAWRRQVAGTVQHLTLMVQGQPDEIVATFYQIRWQLPKDEVFLTNAASLEVIAQTISEETQLDNFAISTPMPIEMAYARVLADGEIPQVAWRVYQQCRRYADDSLIEQIMNTFEGVSVEDLVEASDGFAITTIKPREDGQAGVIVRGVNTRTIRREICLKLWRSFSMCQIVRLDEQPTGGILPIELDGSILFMAAPFHHLTFWFS